MTYDQYDAERLASRERALAAAQPLDVAVRHVQTTVEWPSPRARVEMGMRASVAYVERSRMLASTLLEPACMDRGS